MYVTMPGFGKGFKVRLAGPFERPAGIGYHVEIYGNSGADSISLVGDANMVLDLAEQFNQLAQEVMRQQFAAGKADECREGAITT